MRRITTQPKEERSLRLAAGQGWRTYQEIVAMTTTVTAPLLYPECFILHCLASMVCIPCKHECTTSRYLHGIDYDATEMSYSVSSTVWFLLCCLPVVPCGFLIYPVLQCFNCQSVFGDSVAHYRDEFMLALLSDGGLDRDGGTAMGFFGQKKYYEEECNPTCLPIRALSNRS